MSPEVYALRYGLFDYPESRVFEGAGGGEVELALCVFLVRSFRRNLLVDTGFLDPDLQERWKVRDFVPAAAILERVGLSPARVNDVVLTHGHWDHAGGLRDFLHARVWIARDELSAMQRAVDPGDRHAEGYRWEDLQVLGLAPRLHTFGRRRQVDPCLRASVVSGHTAGCLALTILSDGLPRLVLAGDNAYLYGNLDRRPLPPCSRSGGHDALPRIRHLAGDAPLVPGHDPALFGRFPQVAPGVVRLFP